MFCVCVSVVFVLCLCVCVCGCVHVLTAMPLILALKGTIPEFYNALTASQTVPSVLVDMTDV